MKTATEARIADSKVAADSLAATDLKVAVPMSPSSIAMRVKDRGSSRRLAANIKAAAGFKALSEVTPVKDLKALDEVKTPVKAISVNKGAKARTSESKTAFVIKASPEKLAADRQAESLQDYARYEKDVDELEDAYEEKLEFLDRVICVREAAHRRAAAEFEKVYGRLSEEDLSFV